MRLFLLPALLAALALPGCAKTLDPDDVEKEIGSSLEREAGQKPKKVDCPADVEVKKDKRFDCTVTATDGSTVKANVTLTDDDGKFRYQVDPETLKPAK